MTINLKVPTIVCDGCVETITKQLQKNLPEAQVTIDIDTKTVAVETQASEATVKEIITSTGHTVE
ncbi:MAG: copper chaperone [Gloeocapsa sp. DLM2.Bin57]|jgi:copper chaperone|nr:MAG: copper chaperone [Gloeocapsa sp. DLM2.Bin57]